MLLARKGYDVLLVDRASFPSDTVSTHVIHPPGLTALRHWGLLDDLAATGCPRLLAYTFDFGPLVITGTPTAADGTAGAAYAPRRVVLDELLVRAAQNAGAELREGFSVTDLILDGDLVAGVRGHARGGLEVSEYARVVIGADGVHSRVAGQVNAPRYREGPGPGQCLLRLLVRRACHRGAVADAARPRLRHDPHQRRPDAGPRRWL